ncbi:MAG: efflux RND transporter permease subunit, partial [Pirellulales bacterium]
MTRSFYDRNAQKILLVSALLFFPTMIGALKALKSNKNDVAQWLPSQYEETTTFKWFRQHFAGEQFILMSWDGCTLDDQRLRLMVAKLDPKNHPTRLEAVAEGEPTEVAGTNPAFFKEAITGNDLLERLESEPINLPEDEALARLKGTLIGPDGKTTCIVLTLTEQGKEHMRDCVKLVRRVAQEESNIPLASLHMGGPPVDNVAIDEAGEQSLYRLAGFAAVIGLVISWWCLRNFKLISIVFFAGIYGAAASLAIVWYSPMLLGHEVGWIHVNAILLTMPSLVYVATISGAIHLSNYYRDLLEEGVDIAIAPEKAIRHAWLPLTLATATTSVGLWTLCYSELVPIQLFGLYSGVGVVVSALLLFFHVPAALQVWPLREFARQAALHHHDEPHEESSLVRAVNAVWYRIGSFIIRRNGLVAVGCLALLVACGWGMLYTTTSVHLMRLFPPDARILADYTWLEKHLGDLVPLEVILKIDPKKCRLDFLEKMELVERIQQKLEETEEVGGVLTAVTFSPHLPRAEEYKKAKSNVFARIVGARDPYRTARLVTAKKLLQHRDDYIKGDYLALDDDGTELWRISARVGALNDVDYGDILTGIRQHVAPVLAEQKKQGIEGIEPVYTGLVPLVYKAQRSLLQGLIWGFVSDFVLITIVMMFAVRDLSAGLILALPSIFPAVMVFGIMGWLEIVVDIGTVMAPSVALGVTVDDVVHFMIQYRAGLKAGLSRGESVMLAYKGCARAMYQSWGVIGLGMSVFALSPFTPTQRFGYMMVTLLTSALVGNLLLLPALLAGPLGGLFGRRFTKNRPSQPAPPESERPAAVGAGMRLHPHEPIATDHARRGINA